MFKQCVLFQSELTRNASILTMIVVHFLAFWIPLPIKTGRHDMPVVLKMALNTKIQLC